MELIDTIIKKQNRMFFMGLIKGNTKDYVWKDYVMTNETGIYYIRITKDKNGKESINKETISNIPIKLLKIREIFVGDNRSVIEIKGIEYKLHIHSIVVLMNKLTKIIMPKTCEFCLTDIIKMTLIIQEKQLEQIRG